MSILVRISVSITVLAAGLLALVALGGTGSATDSSSLVFRLAGGAGVSAIVIAMIVLLARNADRRPLEDFGLTPPRQAWRDFGTGVLAWLVPAAVMFVALALLGTPLTVAAPIPELAGVVILLLLAVLLSEAVPEELVFRGYVTGVLGERLRGWWIIVVQAALFTGFALLLRGYTGMLDLSLFAAMGVAFGYLRMISGSVWTSVGFHAAFQTGSQLVLTHNVVGFAGSPLLAMLALGAVPFAVGVALVAARPKSTSRKSYF